MQGRSPQGLACGWGCRMNYGSGQLGQFGSKCAEVKNLTNISPRLVDCIRHWVLRMEAIMCDLFWPWARHGQCFSRACRTINLTERALMTGG